MSDSDTIAAPATPPGLAALALIRISGPLAHSTLRALGWPGADAGRARRCRLHDAGDLLDDVVVTSWKAPRSHTGEDVAEISCHGNPLIVQRILSACCRHGVRPAHPGEFTQRAFLNGRIDLTRAEAVMDLIEARTQRALHAAQRLQEGVLGSMLEREREELLQTLAHLEAWIDFPEEDIDPDTVPLLTARMRHALELADMLLATAREGRWLREGLQVVLAGAPNAGKSSLLNALLQRDRALVSELPGTTRDTLEETIQLGGFLLRLIDTAGLRQARDPLEAMGIERTRRAMEEADLILWVLDSTQPAHFPELPAGKKMLVLNNKCDLNPAAASANRLAVSAHTGEGLSELREAIMRELALDTASTAHDLPLINTRHEVLLRQIRDALDQGLAQLEQGAPPELAAADLRRAVNALAELVGETTPEDVLDRLFARFCIGK